MNRDQHPIVNIEILGDCRELKECEHFCIFTFSDETFKTVQMKGKDIVENYWNIIDNKCKKHLESIYYLNNIKSIEISSICIQSYPCRHDCILIHNDGTITKNSYNGEEIILKFWDFLSDKDKLHFRYLYQFDKYDEDKVIKIEIKPNKCLNPIKNCNHDCILYYQSGKTKEELLSGCEIIHNYWNLLSDSSKIHFGLLIDNYTRDKVYKIEVNRLCCQSKPCIHLCTLYYYDYKKEISLNANEIIKKYWNILSDYDKKHFTGP